MTYLFLCLLSFVFTKYQPLPTFFSVGKRAFSNTKYIGDPRREEYLHSADAGFLCGDVCDAPDYETDYEFASQGWKLRIVNYPDELGRRRLVWINRRGIEYKDKRSAKEITRLFKKFFRNTDVIKSDSSPYRRWNKIASDAGYRMTIESHTILKRERYSFILSQLGDDLGYFPRRKIIELLCADSLSGKNGDNIAKICFKEHHERFCYSCSSQNLPNNSSEWLTVSDIHSFAELIKTSDSSMLVFDGDQACRVWSFSKKEECHLNGSRKFKFNNSSIKDTFANIVLDPFTEMQIKKVANEVCDPIAIISAFQGDRIERMLIGDFGNIVLEIRNGKNVTYKVCTIGREFIYEVIRWAQTHSHYDVNIDTRELDVCPILYPKFLSTKVTIEGVVISP